MMNIAFVSFGEKTWLTDHIQPQVNGFVKPMKNPLFTTGPLLTRGENKQEDNLRVRKNGAVFRDSFQSSVLV